MFLQLVFLLYTFASTQGVQTSCEAQAVHPGEPATIQCHFPTDISVEKRSFLVHTYRTDSTPEEVLSCIWVNNNNNLTCDIDKRYKYDHKVTDRLQLDIPSASEEYVGRYVCQLMPAEHTDFVPCNFTLKGDVAPSPSSESDQNATSADNREKGEDNKTGLIVGIVITVILVALIAGVLAFLFSRGKLGACRRLTVKAKTPEEHPLQDYPLRPTPLHEACASGDSEKVRDLLDSSAVNEQLEAQDHNKQTPLHLACNSGQETVISILLKAGADVEARDNTECTPLHLACSSGKRESVKILLDAHADIEALDEHGRTPLHLACGDGNDEIPVVQLLLNAKANIEAHDNDGFRPLHVACNTGKIHITETLVQRGANKRAKTTYGKTPRDIAVQNVYKKTAELV